MLGGSTETLVRDDIVIALFIPWADVFETIETEYAKLRIADLKLSIEQEIIVRLKQC